MSAKRLLRLSVAIIALVVFLVAFGRVARAATFYKANNTNNLNLTTSWSGGAVPGSGDVATWDNTVTGANAAALGTNPTWGGIKILDPGGPVTINAGNWLYINGSGIDMSAATQDLTLNCGTVINASQTWSVAAGRTVTMTGGYWNSYPSSVWTITGPGMIDDRALHSGGSNSFSGALNLNGGILQVGAGDWNALMGATVTIGDGAELRVTTKAQNLTTTLSLNKGGLLSGSGDSYGGWLLRNVNVNDGTKTALISSTDVVLAGTNGSTFTVGSGATSGIDLDVTGIISNKSTQGLVKAGLGVMRLSGVNTYTTGTTVNAGTLSISNGGRIYSAGGTTSSIVTVNSGGTLEIENWGFYDATNNPGATFGTLGYAAGNIAINGGTLRHITTSATAGENYSNYNSRPLTIGANGATLESATAGQKWTLGTFAGYNIVNTSGNVTLTGAGAGQIDKVLPGSGSLTKSGGGTWTLTAANTFTGGAFANGGVLAANGPNSASGTLGSGNVTVNNGGTITVGGDNALVGYTTSAAKTITINAGGLISTTSYANHLNALVMNGGTLSATSANGTSGNWNFDQGVSTPGAGLTSYITGGNALLCQTGGTVIDVGSGDTLNVSTSLAHIGALADTGLIKRGSGTLVLSGANYYTSATTINGGTLELSGGYNRIQPSNSITVGSGATLTVTGYAQNINALTLAGGTLAGTGDGTYGSWLLGQNVTVTESSTISAIAVTVPKTGGVTFNVASGKELNVSGTIVHLALNSDNGLIKAGEGTMTLGATNTYVGPTTINAGTMKLNGSLAAGSAVAVNGASPSSFGTLGGSGTVNGPLTVNSYAHLAPSLAAGAAATTLNTSGNVTLAAGSFLDTVFTLDGAANDLVQGAGTNTLTLPDNGLVRVNLWNEAGGLGNGTYTLLDNFAWISGTASNAMAVANSPLIGKKYTFDQTTGAVTLTIATLTDAYWNGSGANDDWTTALNWGGSAPQGGETLHFAGSARLTPFNNVADGTQFGGIQFEADASEFNAGGNAIQLTGDVVNNSSNHQTIALAIQLMGDRIVNTGAAGKNITLAGNLTGAGSLTKNGPGTLVLNGDNTTYVGDVAIAAGCVQAGSASALPATNLSINALASLDMNGNSLAIANLTGAGTVTSSAAGTLVLTVNSVGSTTFDGVIENGSTTSVGLTKQGAGSLTLTNANTYTGDTNLGAGALIVSGTLASGNVNVNGGTLQLAGGPDRLDIATNVTVNSPGTFNLNNQTQTLAQLSGSGTVILGTGRVTVGAGTFSGVLSAAGGRLTKTGEDTFTLAGTGNNSGLAVDVLAGTLVLGKTANYPLDSVASVESGATVRLADTGNGDQFYGYSNLTLTGGTFDTNGMSETMPRLNGTGTVTNDKPDSTSTLTLGENNFSNSFSGTIQDGDTGGVIELKKTGTGTLTLSGTNIYSGATSVNAGVLQLTKAAALYGNDSTKWTADNIKVAAGATLQINVGGSEEFTSASVGALASYGGFAAGSYLALDTTNASTAEFVCDSAVVDPNGGANILGLTKLGANALTLTGANTYSGGTILSAGQLNINSVSAIGTGPLTINGGTLGNTSAGPVALANNNAQNWNANFTFVGTQDLNLGAGPVTMSAARTVTVSAGNLTVGGNITGAFGFLKNGNGTLTLGGTNNFATVEIDAGVLAVNSIAALGSGYLAIEYGSTFRYTGSGSETLSRQIWIDRAGSPAATFDVTQPGANLSITANGGSLSMGGLIKTGPGTLTWGGSPFTGGAVTVQEGTLTLTGVHTYSGGTTINGGTLQLGDGTTNGSVTGSIVNNAQLVINTVAAQNFSAVISTTAGIGNVTKIGPETLTLVKPQSYNGSTQITGGTLQLRPLDTAPQQVYAATLNSTSAYGGSLGYDFTVTPGNSIVVTQLGYYDAGSNGLTASHTVNITSMAAGTIVATQSVSGGDSGTVSGGYQFISLETPVTLGPGTYRIWGTGNTADPYYPGNPGATPFAGNYGELSFSGGNYWNDGGGFPATGGGGATPYQYGAVSLKFYDPASGSLPDSTVVQLGAASGTAPRLDLNGASQQVAALADASEAAVTGIVTNSAGTSPAALTLGADDALTNTFSGTIEGGEGKGVISLIKTGSNTQVLAATNTYTGGTTVSGGTLEFAQSVSLPADGDLTIGGTGIVSLGAMPTITAPMAARSSVLVAKPVPEPGTLLLLAVAGGALMLFRRRGRGN